MVPIVTAEKTISAPAAANAPAAVAASTLLRASRGAGSEGEKTRAAGAGKLVLVSHGVDGRASRTAVSGPVAERWRR
jgi:hypothetical protein